MANETTTEAFNDKSRLDNQKISSEATRHKSDDANILVDPSGVGRARCYGFFSAVKLSRYSFSLYPRLRGSLLSSPYVARPRACVLSILGRSEPREADIRGTLALRRLKSSCAEWTESDVGSRCNGRSVSFHVDPEAEGCEPRFWRISTPRPSAPLPVEATRFLSLQHPRIIPTDKSPRKSPGEESSLAISTILICYCEKTPS